MKPRKKLTGSKKSVASMPPFAGMTDTSSQPNALAGRESVDSLQPFTCLPKPRKSAKLPSEDDGLAISVSHMASATLGRQPTSELCAKIRALHRQSRFAMKSQSRIGRSLEAFVRVNVFGFNPHDDAANIEKASKATMALLKKVRAGKAGDEYEWLAQMVYASDTAQAPWDDIRNTCEKQMRLLATQLPCFDLVAQTAGFGALGLAQLIGEIGDVSNFSTVSKVWKRMGFAPMHGYAASSLRTNRANGTKMTSEDWTTLGYKPERYAIAYSLADSMFRHQIASAAKSGEPYGKAKGPYGEVYISRRLRTAETHPEWSKAHAHADGLRVMMKALLRDLFISWHRLARTTTKPMFELPVGEIQELAV